MAKTKTKTKKTQQQNTLDVDMFFASPVYSINRRDFLDRVSIVSDESLDNTRGQSEMNELWPHMMSGDISGDERIQDFVQYVLSTSWNVLVDQGYVMDNYEIGFTSMWAQEHHLNSDMPEHIHSDFSQLIAFYFLEVPKNSSALVIHDPRPGKVQIDLLPANIQNISHASRQVFIKPNAGDLIITNAYLAHSFTRNMDKLPIKFVHMNIGAWPAMRQQTCNVSSPEII